jgi:hypothetical protein
MAQADYVSNAVRALITGAGAKSPTNSVRLTHAELAAALAGNPPSPILLHADVRDLEERADHLKKVLDALSLYVTAILDDTAQNIPAGLDLRQIDTLLSNLTADVTGTSQWAADAMAENKAGRIA